MARRKTTSENTPAKRKSNGQFDFGNEGRGKKWKTPDELRSHIMEYINACDMNQKPELIFGKIKMVPHPIPYTIEGLAHHLGVNRKTLLNYQKRKGYEPFFHIIHEFKEYVLRSLTERALMGDTHATFTMFLLKNNYGFVDKKEIEHQANAIEVKRPQRPQLGE